MLKILQVVERCFLKAYNGFMLLCSLLAFAISAVSIPFIISFCHKHGIYDSINERKVHTGKIPRLGSVGFVPAFTIGVVVYLIMEKQQLQDVIHVLPLVIAGFIIFVFGVIDDLTEMKAKAKLAVQVVAASIVVFSGYRFTNFFGWELPWIISAILTMGWIIGLVNSYNLIDGVDALCGGLSCICSLTMAHVFFYVDTTATATFVILVGAVFGFLLYNKPKAKTFMGDGGSQFLGFVICTLPLYKTDTVFEPQKLALILLICALPVFDTIAAMWRRTREHRSFFSPDKAHLHHKLMNLGFHTPGILVILYSMQILLCAMVMGSLAIGGQRGLVVLFIGYIVAILFFTIIHYTNRAVILSRDPNFKSELDEH